MPNRDNRVWAYLTDEELEQLEDWADNAGKSKSHLVRDAILEYLDNDRASRVEGRIDELDDKMDRVVSLLEEDGSHTHKGHVSQPSQQPQTTTEKAERIAELIQRDTDGAVFKQREVDAAIKEIAGGDDRTLRKYRDELRERRAAFEHPNSDSPVWTTDAEQFAKWADAHVSSVPSAELRHDVLPPYGLSIEEYEQLLPAESHL